MPGKTALINAAIQVRLSAAQIAVLAPGLELLFWSYQTRLHRGSSPLTYPFRILPPPRGFDRGACSPEIMEKILQLRKDLITNIGAGRMVEMDSLQLRAAAFAVRAYIDYVRLLRHQQRGKHPEVKAKLHIDDKSLALLKAKTQRVIHSLERHMKRANRASMKAVGKEQYAALIVAWKAHLRWMRLRIAYCKPWAKPIAGLRARQQRDLDELTQMAKRGLRNAGYQPPKEREFRRIMRLYARYARRGRQGHWTVHFLLENKAMFSSTYHLAQFVIERSNLKELSRR